MNIIRNKIDLTWESWMRVANLPRKSQTKIEKEILILFFQYFFEQKISGLMLKYTTNSSNIIKQL